MAMWEHTIMHVESEIADVETRRSRAIVAGDIAALRTLTDDAYVHVDVSGLRRDRDDFLAALSGGTRYDAYDVLENAIAVHGDVAVVTGTFRNVAHTEGKLIETRGRHVRVYVRGSDGWKNILHQGTRMPE